MGELRSPACPVCNQIHHVNPHTGVVLGEKPNKSASVVAGFGSSSLRVEEVSAGPPGSGTVLAKLSELLFVEAVRRYAKVLPGWPNRISRPRWRHSDVIEFEKQPPTLPGGGCTSAMTTTVQRQQEGQPPRLKLLTRDEARPIAARCRRTVAFEGRTSSI